MADRIYGIDRGETEFKVTEGAASPGQGVEVVLDLVENFTKEEFIRALRMIENHVLKNQFPPA